MEAIAMTNYDEICALAKNLTDEQSEKVIGLMKGFGTERPKKFHYVIGIDDGKYKIPDDIDGSNDEIAKMFVVAD